jgi:hypothetical protein
MTRRQKKDESMGIRSMEESQDSELICLFDDAV